MRKVAYLVFAFVLAACGDADDDEAKVRIVNALYGYNTLDLVVGDQVKVDDLPYGQRSSAVQIGVTNKEGEDPDGDTTTSTSAEVTTSSTSSTSTSAVPTLGADADATTTTVSSTTTTTTTTTLSSGTRTLLVFVDSVATRLIEQAVSLVAKKRYTFYAYQGAGSGERARLIVQQESKQRFVEGKLKLRIAGMAPSAGIVDVYVLQPGQTILDRAPASRALAPTRVTEYVDVDPGDYRVVLASVGTKQVVFDSGAVGLTAGTRATMTILEQKGGGPELEFLLTAD